MYIYGKRDEREKEKKTKAKRRRKRRREKTREKEEFTIHTLVIFLSTEISTPSPSRVPTTALFLFVIANYAKKEGKE
jgi:hypothetical protein